MLSSLPSPNEILRSSRAMAVLDAMFSKDWSLRYFSVDNDWAPGEVMVSMRNGQGDHYFCLSSNNLFILKGYDRYSDVAEALNRQKGPVDVIKNNIPSRLLSFVNEPAFIIEETSFLIWIDILQNKWERLDFPMLLKTNSNEKINLLDPIIGGALHYHEWAEEYYERKIDRDALSFRRD